MKPKHKVMVLIVIAVLALSALFYVNLQHVRDTGRRGAVSSGEDEKTSGGPFSMDLDGVPGWSFSDAA
ncbi:hypothetical protein [Streptomyces sp. NPDC059893]|uniref:hypothetical protein n=1 Tax=Streptomyces sp. NPDC059893 TaxID=3346990 RepID=UPI003666A6F3